MFRQLFAATAACLTLVTAGPLLAKMDKSVCKSMTQFDTDNDGKLAFNEALAAAAAAFDRLDRDKDQSLKRAELKGRLSKRQAKLGDGDKNGKLDRVEFTAIVETMFKSADLDKDNALECKELRTVAGRSMMRLLK